MNKSIIVIPAYQPDDTLLSLVKDMTHHYHTPEFLIVDDGSAQDRQPIFSQLASMPNVTVLHHAVNLGKGQALKTAFNYCLTQTDESYRTIITADADGQHLPEDIYKVQQQALQTPQTLWLGARKFEGKVPWRSQFGNALTRKVFKFFVGQAIYDTQTGLRAIPRDLLANLLKIRSSGYEFELDMLVHASQHDICITEIPIHTVYETGNKSSHFNVLTDSLKIYFVFIRFFGLSLITSLVDLLVFVLVFLLSESILVSAFSARLVAGSFNFICGKVFVFQSKHKLLPEAIKYASLVISLGMVTYAAITSLVTYLGMNLILAKFLVEGTLFIASFSIQKLFVFNGRWRNSNTVSTK
jgi:glycosyltransferase involved in cell wall biosynthesis